MVFDGYHSRQSSTPAFHEGVARFSRKNGKPIWVQRVSTPISDETGSVDLYARADASGEPFDVVIMDLNIPGGLGGRETIRRLQERYANVNAIVSSGYSNDPITANYINYGFEGVLPKPYTMKQLEEAIQKALIAQ